MVIMTTKRKIVKASAPVISVQEKQATGFIDDISMGDIFATTFWTEYDIPRSPATFFTPPSVSSFFSTFRHMGI